MSLMQAGMFFTARLGSGLVIGRLPDNYDDDSEASSNAANATSDTPREQRRRRAQRGLPRWSAPSAMTCSGVGYGFQMGLELIDVVIILNTPSALEAFASATQVRGHSLMFKYEHVSPRPLLIPRFLSMLL